MFGIGFQEILLVLLIALIFFGPKKLPDLAKSLGKGVAEFKKAADEVKKSFDEAVDEEELKDELSELKNMGDTLEKDVKEEFAHLEQNLENKGKDKEKEAKVEDGKEKEFNSPDEG